jgi:hypothetical protein
MLSDLWIEENLHRETEIEEAIKSYKNSLERLTKKYDALTRELNILKSVWDVRNHIALSLVTAGNGTLRIFRTVRHHSGPRRDALVLDVGSSYIVKCNEDDDVCEINSFETLDHALEHGSNWIVNV